MKPNELIPVRSIVVLPRWLLLGGVGLSVACIAAGIGLAIYGFATASGGQLGGWLGGAFGCIIGGAGALFGTLNDQRRRIPAPLLFVYLQRDQPAPFYKLFWPSVALFAVGLATALLWGGQLAWRGGVQVGGIMAFIAGTMEAIRRHMHRQAVAVFTLYAEGVLAADDAAAIDDARTTDPKFDAAVKEHQRIVAAVAGEAT
jgi:hypothetical protein